jgi:fluoride ion exporter CrcB/FEX
VVALGFSFGLNPRHPQFPLGTLASNLVGGYLVGLAVAFFWRAATCRRSGACSSSPVSAA